MYKEAHHYGYCRQKSQDFHPRFPSSGHLLKYYQSSHQCEGDFAKLINIANFKIGRLLWIIWVDPV